jgi:hypothetical protein
MTSATQRAVPERAARTWRMVLCPERCPDVGKYDPTRPRLASSNLG